MDWDRIIALDLGKFNSVGCVMETKSREHRFIALSTSPQSLHDFLVQHSENAQRSVVVIETCDAAGWVHDLATSLGFEVAVANPSHDAWRWRKIKRKTDRDDAIKLAKMALLGELPTVHMPSAERRQKRRLILHRRSLVERRTQCKNAIRSIYSQQGLPLPRGTKCWTKAGIEQLREDSKSLDECSIDDLWRGRLRVELQLLEAIQVQIRIVEKKLDELADEKVKLLESVPGVGTRLAEVVEICLDDPHRFKSGAEVSAYAGLVPKQIESGEMKRVGRITRRGPSLLRGMLVEVAWLVYRHNEWARSFVMKVSRGMKLRKKIAIVALARKLLVILWGMLRKNEPWRSALSSMETNLAIQENTIKQITMRETIAVT